jgi:D-tyrosyl-tRNA(Tyr) deacylase
MKVVVQRVAEASVSISGEQQASIGHGMLILLGVAPTDTAEDSYWLVKKISQLRIFSDSNGHMNTSLLDVEGEALVVSQFTLHASTKKGNRPSFIASAKPDIAMPLYEQFVAALAAVLGKPVSTGVFGANMQVALINDGPVTLVIDSKNRV